MNKWSELAVKLIKCEFCGSPPGSLCKGIKIKEMKIVHLQRRDGLQEWRKTNELEYDLLLMQIEQRHKV